AELIELGRLQGDGIARLDVHESHILVDGPPVGPVDEPHASCSTPLRRPGHPPTPPLRLTLDGRLRSGVPGHPPTPPLRLTLDGRLRSGVPGIRPRLRFVSHLMVDSAPASRASAHASASSHSTTRPSRPGAGSGTRG